MPASRTISWTSLVAQADPEHTRKSRINREYEFTGVRGGNPKNHDGSTRFFAGDYQSRGVYADQTAPTGVITLNGVPIMFQGGFVTLNV